MAAAQHTSEDDVPPSFVCPISYEIMEDPVVTADGHSYDRASIEEWLQRNDTSPVTGLRLDHPHLTPSHALRNAIDEWRQSRRRPPTDGAPTAPSAAALPSIPPPSAPPSVTATAPPAAPPSKPAQRVETENQRTPATPNERQQPTTERSPLLQPTPAPTRFASVNDAGDRVDPRGVAPPVTVAPAPQHVLGTPQVNLILVGQGGGGGREGGQPAERGLDGGYPAAGGPAVRVGQKTSCCAAMAGQCEDGCASCDRCCQAASETCAHGCDHCAHACCSAKCCSDCGPCDCDCDCDQCMETMCDKDVCGLVSRLVIHVGVIVGFALVLVPGLFMWAEVGDYTISLWQNCSSPGGNINASNCVKYDLSENDINSQRGLWLDGSKAGCLLAAFFSFVTLCMLLCCNRWGGRQYSIIGTSAMSTAMGMAGVGAFFGFLGPEVENIYTPHDGLFIAISSCALALISAIVSCLCLSDSYSYYDLA